MPLSVENCHTNIDVPGMLRTVEDSYNETDKPSGREVVVAYVYRMTKYIMADWPPNQLGLFTK